MDQSPLPTNPKGAGLSIKAEDLGQFEVICRVRPLQDRETASDIAVNEDKPTITITQQGKNISKEFSFHKLYKQDCSQAQFTAELADSIFQNCRINDKGSLILSYGVTNSGKTFTILGTEDEPGLLPIIVEKALREFPSSKLKITAIQAYNDQFYCLENKKKLLPTEYYGTYQFDDYQPEEITIQSIRTMIKLYIKNRSQADTRANKNSSRSHAIFKVQCEAMSVAIVDLAGSERLNKANTNAQETTSINTSLLVLGRCIHAFRDHNVVPYRESKLTRALAEYFNSLYKIYMVAHINRSGEMFHENINVLEYAAVSMTVRHLNPQMNRSILKSARKKSAIAKSSLKNNQEGEADNSFLKTSEIEKTGQGKKKPKKVQIEEDPLEKLLQEDLQKKKRMAMEIYISQMIAKMEEFDYYLDREFEVQDKRDQEFLEEMRNAQYVSPEKASKVRQSVIEAENRIKIRKEILDEIQKEKLSQRSDCGTHMGPSMKKCLEESIRRSPLQEKEQQPVQAEQKCENAITPAKVDEQEDQSILEKILSKSKTVFKSTSKAIQQVVYSLRQFSRKKEAKRSVERRKPNLSISNLQVNEMFQHRRPEVQQKSASESSKQVSDFVRLLQKIDNASTNSGDQTSFLLDSFNQSEDEHKIKVYFNHEEKQKPNLIQIRESEEFNQQKNSPFFKDNSQVKGKQQKEQIKKIEKESTFEESVSNSQTIEHHIANKNQRDELEEKSVQSIVTTENGDSKQSRKRNNNKKALQFKVQHKAQQSKSPIKTRSQRAQISKKLKIV